MVNTLCPECVKRLKTFETISNHSNIKSYVFCDKCCEMLDRVEKEAVQWWRGLGWGFAVGLFIGLFGFVGNQFK